MAKRNPHIGSTLDDFLAENGLLHEAKLIALKRVIALYAGAEAQKHVDSDLEAVKLGASGDDEKAGNYLRLLDSTENELRERTAKLISEHWALVELIASELLHHKTLIGDEVDILLDVYRGETTMEELEEFRVRFLRRTDA